MSLEKPDEDKGGTDDGEVAKGADQATKSA